MSVSKPPIVQVQMLIRKPAQQVFDAFIDPAITTRFWFTRSSGRMQTGAQLQWDWEMYGASVKVQVKQIDPPKRILVDWGEPARSVEWTFDSRADGTTLVRISESGFSGSDDGILAQALDSQGGFSYLLAAAKAFLEHGIELNLVADHHPDAHVATGG